MNSKGMLSDEELFAKLKLGSRSALNEIYKRYHAPLFSHAYKKLQSTEEVKDILQDVFLNLWTNKEIISINNSLSFYLFGSVRNRVLNVFRNTKVREMYSKSLQEFINKGENVVDLELREKELISIVEQEIANLPPQMRLVFEMSRNLELSHKEIASELNISSHTVRTQVRNALRILRVKLSSDIFSIFF
jgi:RNA polymerase sigma-70 factor (family 1)